MTHFFVLMPNIRSRLDKEARQTRVPCVAREKAWLHTARFISLMFPEEGSTLYLPPPLLSGVVV